MTRRFALVTIAAVPAIALGLAACHREGPLPGRTVSGRGVVNEAEHQVVMLDRALYRKFSFEQPWHRRVDNDRLQVILSIRNRTNFTQSVDVSTAFRDEVNAPLNDETAWTRLTMGPNETKTYTATSIGPRAQNFTVRLREGM
jgi:hypothetical protein